jgi:hypothetical protein
MNWDAMKPMVSWVFRIAINAIGVFLMTHGTIKDGAGLETFLGMATSAGATFWSWWVTDGHIQAAKFLQNVTQTATTAAAVEVAKHMQYTPAVAVAASDAKVVATALEPAVMLKDAAKAAIILVLLAAGALAFTGDAQAQTRKPVINLPLDPLHLNTGPATSTLDDIAATLAKPFQDIANFIGDDATGAVSLATQVPTLQDGHGQQCWMAMEQFGEVIKAHPIPITFHVITDYETLRLLGMATNNLCSNVHCTQVFSDATAMAQAASPMPLAIPSLHDLCTKVPQIAVVAPVTIATPTPTTAPATK